MNTIETVVASLELVTSDITAQVYERFFSVCPSAQAVMGHSDDHMRGRMLEQVVGLLLEDEHFGAGGYLDWELDNHLVGYRVTGEMYGPFFEALHGVVREVCGDAWHEAMDRAWTERTQYIMSHVLAHPACTGPNAP